MSTITFNSVSPTAAASRVFVEGANVNRGVGSALIPRKILVLGQYNSGKSPTDNTPQLILSKSDADTRYGPGSLLSSMISRILASGGGTPVYALPLADTGDDATGTFAISSGPATAAGTFSAYVAGIRVPVSVAVGDTATEVGDALEAAINANVDLPVTAANVTGTVTCTSKWAGESANQIQIEINRADSEALPAGLACTVTDMASGATDPTLTTALGNLGDTWFTDVVCPYTSVASLTALEAAGVVREGPTVNRPFVGLVGYTDTYANLLTALDSRNSEWTSFIPVHGSPTPGFMIAASCAAVFAKIQQNNPGRPVKNQILPGVVAGDTNDLTYAQRDAAVKAGGSHTYNLSDDTVKIGDLCTTRTTEDGGAETDAYRFTIIIPNFQFKRYALEQKFIAEPFASAVVIADGSGRGPTYAIRPSDVKTVCVGLVDDWVERALSTDRDTIVDGIVAEIDGTNAGRINVLIPDIAVAGLRIVAVKHEWAFITG